MRTAHGLWAEREGMIVRLEGADRAGWGEAAPVPGFEGGTMEEVEQACRHAGGTLDTARPFSGPNCFRHALASAIADLAGPPPPGAASLPVAALLPAGKPALAELQARADSGFRTFKWKVGVGDAGDELALLDDVCARLPEGSRLRLDANGAWGRRAAERWLSACAERPVEFVEQPAPRGADDLLLGLAADFPVPLALDESLAGGDDVERWLGAGWPGVFVVKPSLVADLPAALSRLAAAGAAVVFSSALETAVGARAALRAAFGWPGAPRALGFGVWPLFADPRFNGPAAAPFVRREDLKHLNPEAVWTALS